MMRLAIPALAVALVVSNSTEVLKVRPFTKIFYDRIEPDLLLPAGYREPVIIKQPKVNPRRRRS